MNLRKWIGTIPILTVILIGCINSEGTAMGTTSTHITAGIDSTVALSTEENLFQPSETPGSILPWYAHPPSDPGLLGESYGLLETGWVHIYSTLAGAVNEGEKFYLAPQPPAYLAYDQTQVVNGKTYVHLADGGWMPGSDLKPVDVTTFSGLIISSAPSHIFGWVLHDAMGWVDPSAKESSGRFHKRYDPVSVATVINGYAEVDQGDWLALADLALIDLGRIKLPAPSTCRWIDIALSSQTLIVFDKCQPVFATLISSAKAPAITPTGTFTFYYKEKRLPLFANERVETSESFYLADVPWLMFFREGWAIHGAYWHDRFGEPWSHGCVNVSPYDALWLYDWSKLGDIIVIHE